ncbi:MAG: ArsA-related P-loop ATPase [Planctomycetota bacterium]|nr:ArsA-related P-loop ATPase [Planctomycetota bacterium]
MSLPEKRLIIVGGKGGVGKSVIAAAVALLAARQGKKTLLLGVDTLDRFDALLGYQGEEKSLKIVEDNLYSTILNPKSVANDFIETHVPIRTLSKKIANSGLFKYWFEATPMLSELLMLGKIWKLVTETKRRSAEPVWDCIVVEAPATGHSLGLLGASETAAQLLVGPMRSKADEITAMLRDPELCNLIITTLAEEMPVAEALELQKLATQKLGMTIGAIVINAIYPKILQDKDADALSAVSKEAYPEGLSDALENAVQYSTERRARAEHFRDVIRNETQHCVELPFLLSEKFGREQIEELADLLSKPGSGRVV